MPMSNLNFIVRPVRDIAVTRRGDEPYRTPTRLVPVYQTLGASDDRHFMLERLPERDGIQLNP